MIDRHYLNADHDPADFATCPVGHPTRQFDLPVASPTTRSAWILAYVCDACAAATLAAGRDPYETPMIMVPHQERIIELRATSTTGGRLIKH